MKLYKLVLAVLIGIGACKTEKPQVITYEVTIKNFSEIIHGVGTLESANNASIVVPRIYANDLKIAWLAPEGDQVHEGDTVCILEGSELNVIYENTLDEVTKAKADLIKMEAQHQIDMGLLERQLQENNITQELSQLDSIQLKFAPPVRKKILELELEKSKIQEHKLHKKIEAQKVIGEQSIRALKSQIGQKEQENLRWKEQLDLMILTAPKNGMMVHAVSPVRIFTGDSEIPDGKARVGNRVFPDIPVVQLPDLDSMQIKMMVQEGDFKRIEKGHSVIIKPEALPHLQTTGTVKNKSLSSKPLSYRYKVKSYEIIIDIDSLDEHFQPGLSANCEIIIQDIPETLTAPTISIFEKDSHKYVYVFEDPLFRKTQVETGLSNQATTIIKSGLAGKELIALREPPFNLIIQNKSTDHE